MLSVITYGRNDGHGYNLAKRAALSFNCIAELLEEPDDEIIFVDCNSEDDYATFPESIADTLTPKARTLLRVYRVRRSLYQQRSQGTHLQVLESFSRNVALRRANPRNRWVLSTNPDMIFVPAQAGGYKALLYDLPDGYYATPRYELPESLWESLNRSEPIQAMEQIRKIAWDLGLHLAVRGDSWNGYDAPGDFQLMPLRHALEIGGFNENMVRGWHVDSNLARRFSIFYGRPAISLHEKVFAYHMMHLRMLTSGHTGRAISRANPELRFIHQVAVPWPEGQPSDWGAPGIELERISLAEKRRSFWQLGVAPETRPNAAASAVEFVDYQSRTAPNPSFHASLERIQCFLANAFDHLPGELEVALWSGNSEMQNFMRRVAEQKRWMLLLHSYAVPSFISARSGVGRLVPDLCILDFTLHFLSKGGEPGDVQQAGARFQYALLAELRHLSRQTRRFAAAQMPTIYCLGVTYTELEGHIRSATPDWDQIPFALGFKRGRFASPSWMEAFVRWQYAKLKMGAGIRGYRTIWDRVALESLRFLARLTQLVR